MAETGSSDFKCEALSRGSSQSDVKTDSEVSVNNLLHYKQEISKEEYDKALSKGACALFNERITLGYACINAKTSEENGKYFLEYDRGNDHAFLC